MERYVIHVTKECNMKCTYCYEKDKVSTYTWNEVEKLIDNLVKHNKEKRFGIEFLGGEPLLAFDLIEKSVEYMEAIPNVEVDSYGITTNGTIVPEGFVDFMKKYPKVFWAASMDGTKDMNQLRIMDIKQNSYDTVIENFKLLARELGGVNRLSIHLVTHPYNVHKLSLGIDHLYKIGFRSMGIGTVESTIIIDDDYCKHYIEQLKIVSDKIKNGEYSNLYIDVLNNLKPRSDTRYYIKDESGKIIAESYGRAKEDITSAQIYKAQAVSSPISSKIEDIREAVYSYHQSNVGKSYAI